MEENQEIMKKSSWETVLEPIESEEVVKVFGQDFADICEKENLNCLVWPKYNNPKTFGYEFAYTKDLKDFFIEIKGHTLIFSSIPKNSSTFGCDFAYTKDLKDAMKEKSSVLRKLEPNINKKLYSRNHKKLQKNTLEFGRVAISLINSLDSTNITIIMEAEGRRLDGYKRLFGEDNPKIVYREITS